MNAVLGWIAAQWPQVQPNLEASLLWVPIGWVGGALSTHLIVGWHHRQLHARLDRHGVAQ